MKKYPIKIIKRDFEFLDLDYSTKGTRVKKIIVDNSNKMAFFKYEGAGYVGSEACSEKMSYEIAKVLGYDCARIELAKDYEGTLGILNYLFFDIGTDEHTDAVSYLNINNQQRKEFYTISNIKKTLNNLNKNLFKEFIKIMIFDALVGEQDRHEENWGIIRKKEHYKISPLYDNGDCLLRDFKRESFAEEYYSGKKNFEAYIKRSKTTIYKEDHVHKYKHFELIEYLNTLYPKYVQAEIENLKKLTDKKIETIVDRIPDDLLTIRHKEYIIDYLKKRRNILLNIK